VSSSACGELARRGDRVRGQPTVRRSRDGSVARAFVSGPCTMRGLIGPSRERNQDCLRFTEPSFLETEVKSMVCEVQGLESPGRVPSGPGGARERCVRVGDSARVETPTAPVVRAAPGAVIAVIGARVVARLGAGIVILDVIGAHDTRIGDRIGGDPYASSGEPLTNLTRGGALPAVVQACTAVELPGVLTRV
jgi:hypothetical protein